MQRRNPRIIDEEECWLCPTCSRWVPRRGYYTRKRSWNGIGTQCRKCHGEGNVRTRDKDKHRETRRVSMEKARARDPEKFRGRDRDASRIRAWSPQCEARYQLNLAVRRGQILKPSRCTRCGVERKLHAHHSDYSRPLAVEWICTRCHGAEHRSA